MIANRKEIGMSFRHLQSQADMMVVAGSETTATSLSGITYYLSQNALAYKALANEVRSTFSRYGDITAHATEPLPYLQAVIEEGLRLYPPVPIGLPRISPGETVDGIYIPKGAIVSVSSWASTHSEQNFHRPFDFIPERWIGNHKNAKDQLSASQPFSIGSRVCLGRKYVIETSFISCYFPVLLTCLSLVSLIWKCVSSCQRYSGRMISR